MKFLKVCNQSRTYYIPCDKIIHIIKQDEKGYMIEYKGMDKEESLTILSYTYPEEVEM